MVPAGMFTQGSLLRRIMDEIVMLLASVGAELPDTVANDIASVIGTGLRFIDAEKVKEVVRGLSDDRLLQLLAVVLKATEERLRKKVEEAIADPTNDGDRRFH